MKPEAQIKALLSQAFDIALAEVERRARQMMKQHPGIRFTMAMGGASFYDKHGEPMDTDDFKYLAPFYNFLEQFDDTLHITGYPMKLITHDGPLVKDW